MCNFGNRFVVNVIGAIYFNLRHCLFKCEDEKIT